MGSLLLKLERISFPQAIVEKKFLIVFIYMMYQIEN